MSSARWRSVAAAGTMGWSCVHKPAHSSFPLPAPRSEVLHFHDLASQRHKSKMTPLPAVRRAHVLMFQHAQRVVHQLFQPVGALRLPAVLTQFDPEPLDLLAVPIALFLQARNLPSVPLRVHETGHERVVSPLLCGPDSFGGCFLFGDGGKQGVLA